MGPATPCAAGYARYLWFGDTTPLPHTWVTPCTCTPATRTHYTPTPCLPLLAACHLVRCCATAAPATAFLPTRHSPQHLPSLTACLSTLHFTRRLPAPLPGTYHHNIAPYLPFPFHRWPPVNLTHTWWEVGLQGILHFGFGCHFPAHHPALPPPAWWPHLTTATRPPSYHLFSHYNHTPVDLPSGAFHQII